MSDTAAHVQQRRALASYALWLRWRWLSMSRRVYGSDSCPRYLGPHFDACVWRSAQDNYARQRSYAWVTAELYACTCVLCAVVVLVSLSSSSSSSSSSRHIHTMTFMLERREYDECVCAFARCCCSSPYARVWNVRLARHTERRDGLLLPGRIFAIFCVRECVCVVQSCTYTV